MSRRELGSRKAVTAPRALDARADGLSARAADLIVAGTIVVVALILIARMGDPLGIRADSWSEAEVVISGLGYAQSGFTAYAGLPQHQIGPPVDPYFLYANYPVLSNLLYGVLHQCGADAHGLFRLPAILASLAAIWLWYRLISRVIDRTTGVIAALALASSFGFLVYADNIHQQAYPLAPQIGALLCFVAGVAPGTARRGRWLVGCAACLLVIGLLTVELDLWLALAFIGYVLLFGTAVPARRLLWLVLPLGVGIGLQWLQSRAGSPVPPEERPGIAENLYRRSIGFAEAIDTPIDADGKLLTVATYPRFLLRRIADFYRIPAWGLVPLILFGFVGTTAQAWPPSKWPAQAKLLAILLIAACGWMGIMMQQSAVHPATMRQLLPFYALLLAVVWTQGFRLAVDPKAALGWKVGALGVGALVLIPHLTWTWSNFRMHLDTTYQHPLFLEPGWQESADLGSLRSIPADSVILTNHNRLPLIRYWSRRPTYLASNRVPRGITSRRSWLELTISYLRGLYHDRLPRLLFVYRIGQPTSANVQRALEYDSLLRALTTGRFEPLASPAARQQAERAFRGAAPATCPVLVRGSDWSCFDMTPLLPELLRSFSSFPIPRLKDLPPPR